jgi:hypothetical protein
MILNYPLNCINFKGSLIDVTSFDNDIINMGLVWPIAQNLKIGCRLVASMTLITHTNKVGLSEIRPFYQNIHHQKFGRKQR